MGIASWWRSRKQISPAERRARLLRDGRITEGCITELGADPDGNHLVYYTYSVHGVDFECAEIITSEQVGRMGKYAPGETVSVRFDPRNFGNSTVE